MRRTASYDRRAGMTEELNGVGVEGGFKGRSGVGRTGFSEQEIGRAHV